MPGLRCGILWLSFGSTLLLRRRLFLGCSLGLNGALFRLKRRGCRLFLGGCLLLRHGLFLGRCLLLLEGRLASLGSSLISGSRRRFGHTLPLRNGLVLRSCLLLRPGQCPRDPGFHVSCLILLQILSLGSSLFLGSRTEFLGRFLLQGRGIRWVGRRLRRR